MDRPEEDEIKVTPSSGQPPAGMAGVVKEETFVVGDEVVPTGSDGLSGGRDLKHRKAMALAKANARHIIRALQKRHHFLDSSDNVRCAEQKCHHFVGSSSGGGRGGGGGGNARRRPSSNAHPKAGTGTGTSTRAYIQHISEAVQNDSGEKIYFRWEEAGKGGNSRQPKAVSKLYDRKRKQRLAAKKKGKNNINNNALSSPASQSAPNRVANTISGSGCFGGDVTDHQRVNTAATVMCSQEDDGGSDVVNSSGDVTEEATPSSKAAGIGQSRKMKRVEFDLPPSRYPPGGVKEAFLSESAKADKHRTPTISRRKNQPDHKSNISQKMAVMTQSAIKRASDVHSQTDSDKENAHAHQSTKQKSPTTTTTTTTAVVESPNTKQSKTKADDKSHNSTQVKRKPSTSEPSLPAAESLPTLPLSPNAESSKPLSKSRDRVEEPLPRVVASSAAHASTTNTVAHISGLGVYATVSRQIENRNKQDLDKRTDISDNGISFTNGDPKKQTPTKAENRSFKQKSITNLSENSPPSFNGHAISSKDRTGLQNENSSNNERSPGKSAGLETPTNKTHSPNGSENEKRDNPKSFQQPSQNTPLTGQRKTDKTVDRSHHKRGVVKRQLYRNTEPSNSSSDSKSKEGDVVSDVTTPAEKTTKMTSSHVVGDRHTELEGNSGGQLKTIMEIRPETITAPSSHGNEHYGGGSVPTGRGRVNDRANAPLFTTVANGLDNDQLLAIRTTDVATAATAAIAESGKGQQGVGRKPRQRHNTEISSIACARDSESAVAAVAEGHLSVSWPKTNKKSAKRAKEQRYSLSQSDDHKLTTTAAAAATATKTLLTAKTPPVPSPKMLNLDSIERRGDDESDSDSPPPLSINRYHHHHHREDGTTRDTTRAAHAPDYNSNHPPSLTRGQQKNYKATSSKNESISRRFDDSETRLQLSGYQDVMPNSASSSSSSSSSFTSPSIPPHLANAGTVDRNHSRRHDSATGGAGGGNRITPTANNTDANNKSIAVDCDEQKRSKRLPGRRDIKIDATSRSDVSGALLITSSNGKEPLENGRHGNHHPEDSNHEPHHYPHGSTTSVYSIARSDDDKNNDGNNPAARIDGSDVVNSIYGDSSEKLLIDGQNRVQDGKLTNTMTSSNRNDKLIGGRLYDSTDSIDGSRPPLGPEGNRNRNEMDARPPVKHLNRNGSKPFGQSDVNYSSHHATTTTSTTAVANNKNNNSNNNNNNNNNEKDIYFNHHNTDDDSNHSNNNNNKQKQTDAMLSMPFSDRPLSAGMALFLDRHSPWVDDKVDDVYDDDIKFINDENDFYEVFGYDADTAEILRSTRIFPVNNFETVPKEDKPRRNDTKDSSSNSQKSGPISRNLELHKRQPRLIQKRSFNKPRGINVGHNSVKSREQNGKYSSPEMNVVIKTKSYTGSQQQEGKSTSIEKPSLPLALISESRDSLHKQPIAKKGVHQNEDVHTSTSSSSPSSSQASQIAPQGTAATFHHHGEFRSLPNVENSGHTNGIPSTKDDRRLRKQSLEVGAVDTGIRQTAPISETSGGYARTPMPAAKPTLPPPAATGQTATITGQGQHNTTATTATTPKSIPQPARPILHHPNSFKNGRLERRRMFSDPDMDRRMSDLPTAPLNLAASSSKEPRRPFVAVQPKPPKASSKIAAAQQLASTTSFSNSTSEYFPQSRLQNSRTGTEFRQHGVGFGGNGGGGAANGGPLDVGQYTKNHIPDDLVTAGGGVRSGSVANASIVTYSEATDRIRSRILDQNSNKLKVGGGKTGVVKNGSYTSQYLASKMGGGVEPHKTALVGKHLRNNSDGANVNSLGATQIQEEQHLPPSPGKPRKLKPIIHHPGMQKHHQHLASGL